MATLLLGGVGSMVGGALFGPVGAMAGRALGAIGGSVLDSALTGGGRAKVSHGPRLSDLDVMTSNEGAPLPRLYGRARLAGQMIWATRLEEVVSTRTQAGSGGKSSRPRAGATTVTYSYFASFALALCEGPVHRIGRLWADGKPMDQAGFTVRAHHGGEGQLPDPWIAAKQPGGAPAYRGIAYLVFERMPLARYGNRIPQITVEVERTIGTLEHQIRAVTLIPGATEFGYDSGQVLRVLGKGAYASENWHVLTTGSDFEASVDQLMAACPYLERVSLVVSWFGDDLRASLCQVAPRVDLRGKVTAPYAWMVNGTARLLVRETSRHEGVAAYGGTPSDASVVSAIRSLKARGLKVTLNPFIMMDVPVGNTLRDPWSGAGSQPTYPWRGRITCDPAPGRPGSPDGSMEAVRQVQRIFGGAQRGHFGRYAGQIIYGGPPEWSLRRMVLHYALLAELAGGVETLLIGSEMVQLTRIRGPDGRYPAVEALIELARDVRAILSPGTRISYGADWTEYGAQTYPDGSVAFPLDPLWASPDIDFIGIDYYPPIADWRDGTAHLDAAEATSPYDVAFLKRRLRAGEAYDWYYPDEAARAAQARRPISDGAYGEPAIHRQKDLWWWWSNLHVPRGPGGGRASAPTAFAPASKPIRITEVGCPAVDKGANRPSVFPDAKSIDGGYPPFSNRRRDDDMQRRVLEAVHRMFEPAAGAGEADNPSAPVTGGRMVEPGCVFCWTWDARPYPEFPRARELWADGANWETGHWLTGRLGGAPLADLVRTVCADAGLFDVESEGVRGTIDGYVIDRPMSVRAALEPLGRAFAFEACESDGRMVFATRGGPSVLRIPEDACVMESERAPLSLVRAQESELPLEVGITFVESGGDYRTAAAASRRLAGSSRHVAQAQLPVVAPHGLMSRAAEVWLHDLWAGRETATFSLPPSYASLAPGDVVELMHGGRGQLLEITRIEDGEARAVTARSIEPEVFSWSARIEVPRPVDLPPAFGPPDVLALELPMLDPAEPVPLLHIAAFASPWPGGLTLWRSADGGSFEAVAGASVPAVMGVTLSDLAPGPVWRVDNSSRLSVKVQGGHLTGATLGQMLEGANACALLTEGRVAEVLQFSEAEMQQTGVYVLTGLLRGQAGTEDAAEAPWPAGTNFVLIDRALMVAAGGASVLGRSLAFRVGPAGRDPGDAAVRDLRATPIGRALVPLPPVHLSARRTEGGVLLSWMRRSRQDADLNALDPPLAEAAEAYRVEILQGAAVRRSFEVASPGLLYPAALEAADLGGPQVHITFRVAQISALVGPGRPALATRRL